MQEEVTQRTIALCVEATKLSAGMLQQAMKKVLDEMQKGVTGHTLPSTRTIRTVPKMSCKRSRKNFSAKSQS